MPPKENPACRSRRSFLQVSAAAAAVTAGYRIVTEPMLAHAARFHIPNLIQKMPYSLMRTRILWALAAWLAAQSMTSLRKAAATRTG